MISLSIPQPQGIEFTAWGAVVAEQLAGFGVQTPADEDGWREWAASLLHEPQLGLAPSPYGFSDWRDWASNFKTTYA